MAARDNPEIFKELIQEHIPYEVRMLRGLFLGMSMPLGLMLSPLITNAMIESFCIHARNLMDFFSENRAVSRGYVAARHFVDEKYDPFKNGRPAESTIGLISKQIAHLTYDRTTKGEKKIGPTERKEFVQVIEAELSNFEAHLKSSYRQLWPDDMRSGRIAFGDSVQVSGPTGPSNAIVEVRGDVGPTGPFGGRG